jgi:hypothetical protein
MGDRWQFEAFVPDSYNFAAESDDEDAIDNSDNFFGN